MMCRCMTHSEGPGEREAAAFVRAGVTHNNVSLHDTQRGPGEREAAVFGCAGVTQHMRYDR